MTSKQHKALILQSIRDSNIDFSDCDSTEGNRRIAQELAPMQFETISDCGTVQVVHDGASALVDIDIAEDFLDHYDHEHMAGVVQRTIQRGETAVREVLTQIADRRRAVE